MVEASEHRTPIEALLDLHDETFAACKATMRAKNKDYTAGSADPYSNFRIAASFGVDPVVGIVLRMSDKMQRIRSFCAAGELAVSGESVDDACDDIVNYAILVKGLLRERRKA